MILGQALKFIYGMVMLIILGCLGEKWGCSEVVITETSITEIFSIFMLCILVKTNGPSWNDKLRYYSKQLILNRILILINISQY